jgi:phospholipid/cholesterol/gamma-HCH transport system ATP-binding protein
MNNSTSHIDKNDIVISIEDLEKSFNGHPVLTGINLNVYKGENVVILGRSGSGKSVLIKIISGLLKADKGTVKVLGEEIDTLSIKQLQTLRLRLGFSFQSSALYDGMTVRENLEFPLVHNKKSIKSKDVNEAVQQVLKDVGLSETINQMPAELSGGQKKRIGIARTLILNPEIMLYDEPTAGLDPITSTEINKLINKVQEKYNTSSIIITHDLTCAKETGNRVAMLINGKLAREGSFEDVFNTTDSTVKDFYNYNFITTS